MLHRIAGGGDQLCAGTNLLAPGPPRSLSRSGSGAMTIRASQLAAGVRPGGHDGGPGGVQHPQRLAMPALAGGW
jgi:hypothetical protein